MRDVFRALAATIVPEAADLDERGWAELEHQVEHALAARPAGMRRQLALFVRALQWLPLLRFGRSFTGLDPARRRRVLDGVQDAPLLLVRRGFWGLRTLVFLGYYTRPAAAEAIGYRANARGWEALS